MKRRPFRASTRMARTSSAGSVTDSPPTSTKRKPIDKKKLGISLMRTPRYPGVEHNLRAIREHVEKG